MSKLIVNILMGIGTILKPLIAPLYFLRQGRKNAEAKQDKNDAEVLQKQRDNDVDTLHDAHLKWVRIRKNRDKQ